MIILEDSVGGMAFRIYKNSHQTARPIAFLFLLHGRCDSWDSVASIAKSLLNKTNHDKRCLWIVTLNHRNHGSRMVDARSNVGWKEKNEHHAVDMYSIQVGTMQDVSFLIDFLPPHLFPHDDCVIEMWGAAGISLGGHSTWLLLGEEPRITVGIPIIGCPDYVELMRHRAQTSGIPFGTPYVPTSLLKVVSKTNPAMKSYTALDGSNPFLGKKILILSGGRDKLVPWTASQRFVEDLQVGPDGEKKIILEENAGHECTDAMVDAMVEFVQTHILSV